MQKLRWLCCTLVLLTSVSVVAQTPSPMTWDQVRQRFEQNNPTLLAGQFKHRRIQGAGDYGVSSSEPRVPLLTADSDRILPGGLRHHNCCGSLLTVAASATCTSASTSGSCVWKARRRVRRLQLNAGGPGADAAVRLRSALFDAAGQKVLQWRRTTWPTRTMCLTSAESVSRPATWRRSTWTGWSCSACSSSPICRPPRESAHRKITLLSS